MESDAKYGCDTEFTKLLARREDINLPVAALELARDAYPDLDFRPTLEWIEQTGDRLVGSAAKAQSDYELLKNFADEIAGRQEIVGDDETYYNPENSYLNRVLARKRGIPISLSVLYMAVAERAGVTLDPVSAPHHFLTRFEAVDGPLFLDAFGAGQILDYSECIDHIREHTGFSPSQCEAALEPVTPREVVIRMLNNLKAIYAKSEDWTAAWCVQYRLVLLKPGVYDERRDLGLIALKANRPGEAINMLENCLKTCPDEETQPLTVQIEEARRQLVRWN